MQERIRSTVIVIGATRGIGLALAQRLSERGDRVVAACWRASPALRSLSVEMIEGLDIASADSVAGFVRHLGPRTVNMVVVAAPLAATIDRPAELENLDFERVREHLEIHTIGPLRVAHALVRTLQKGSKLFFLTSDTGAFDSKAPKGHYGCRMSKAALNVAGRTLARDLQDRAIAVGLLDPGLPCGVPANGRDRSVPHHLAGLLIKLMDDFSMSTSGEFMHARGKRIL